nr:hypothetical protein [Chloroflexota bacterium]
MRSSANIRSVQALEDLKGALVRFGADAQMALSAAAMEIRRALEWLAERQSYWQGEVCRRDGIVAGARAALTACLASGDREHPPSRGAYQAALVQAQRRLGEAQAELRKLKQWSAAIHDALASYQREAQRLDALLGGDLPRASALLGRKIATLHD